MCFAICGAVHYCRSGYWVSIPFSSGCALQFADLGEYVAQAAVVSIPFSSGCALQSSYISTSEGDKIEFQFPFRRDVLCNVMVFRISSLKASTCFNSLFVGMCFAIRK